MKKGLGATLAVIGVSSCVGAMAVVINGGIINQEEETVIGSLFIAGVSAGLAWLGAVLYEGGDLARYQWQKLREFLDIATESGEVNHSAIEQQ